jgi:hypothetical protein
MGVLLESKYPVESQEFISRVLSDKGKAVLEKYGFAPVAGGAAKTAGTATAAKAEA